MWVFKIELGQHLLKYISSFAVGEAGKSDNKRLKLAYDFISSIDNTGIVYKNSDHI